MSTRRVVFVVLVVAGACLALAAGLSHGSWRDLWLNLFAEAVGAAFIVLFVDVLFERSKARDQDTRRRIAIEELGSILRELQRWLDRMYVASGATAGRQEHADAADRLTADLNGLASNLGTIDFAAPGSLKRDRYFIEWASRSFEETTIELARWEVNFVDAMGLFDDEFRRGAESLGTFIRAMSSFLKGMERYILREQPASPVFAYEGVTELTLEDSRRLVSKLHAFLLFYREQRERYGVGMPA